MTEVIIETAPATPGLLNRLCQSDPISCSKVTVILLKGWILPIGGVALGKVGACSLRSRLVFVIRQSALIWSRLQFDSQSREAPAPALSS